MKRPAALITSPRSAERGVALVTTVIVVAVLAVVAVAFMQSATVDRLSARISKEYMQAQLAADAGAAVAESMLAGLVGRYPDSVTVWQNIGGGGVGGTNNEATVLYARATGTTTNGARPGQFGSQVSLVAQPLVSRAGADLFTVETNPVPISAVGSLMPFSTNNMVNVNSTNSSRLDPLVGSRGGVAPVNAAQWIYLSQNGGPTNATNPIVARYAFWIEDESFKVNLNLATNGNRGNATNNSLGLTARELRLDGATLSSSNAGVRGADTAAVAAARGTNSAFFPTAGSAAVPANLPDAASASDFRFLTTVHSAGTDLSRGGFQRFNLNSITNGVTGPLDAVNIRTGLDRVITAITNSNSVPLFGQRFYGHTNAASANVTNAVLPANARAYLQKIAANLMDYVDNNDQPTIISNNPSYTILAGKPTYGIEAQGGGLDGANSIVAMGVENVPRLQEYAIHARIRRMQHDPANRDSFGFNSTNDVPNPTQATFEVWLDHYFEFWNPGTRDIRLTNAFLKIYDQPAFGPGVSGPLGTAGRETTEIPLGTVTFRAGRTTILTTAKSGEVSAAANATTTGDALIDTTKLASLADIVSLTVPDADRKFTGTTTSIKEHAYNSSGSYGPDFPYDRLFQVNLRPRSTSVTDYQSAVLIGNDNGILESFVGLPIGAETSGTPAIALCVSNGYIRDGMEVVGSLGAGHNDNVRGGSLIGNSLASSSPASVEGDPRALNEQLRFTNYTGSIRANPDQTRFGITISGTNDLPDSSSMGLPNTNFVFPNRWVDYSSTASGATNAPLYVRNGALQSIGELGHITDPARVPGPGGINLARGGGRTLRVGQPEHPFWFDSRPTNASRTWASWRLADIFTTTSISNSGTAANAAGVLTNSLGVARGITNANGQIVAIPGLINPNGVLRDGGAAWRAALHGLSFLPVAGGLGEQGLTGKPADIDAVVTNARARLTNVTAAGLPAGTLNAFWERGEISELGLLNSGSGLAGVGMTNVFDRGREELVRRSIEMITPRGSVFSVYVVGQALQVSGATTNVVGSVRLKETFRLDPVFPNGLASTDDAFDPVGGVSQRFAPVTNYTINVLSRFYD
jgi:hypothetical protein